MYDAEQDEVGGVSSVSVHYMTELSEMSDSKKMSSTSIYSTVRRCRRLIWIFFLKDSQDLGICVKVQYF